VALQKLHRQRRIALQASNSFWSATRTGGWRFDSAISTRSLNSRHLPSGSPGPGPGRSTWTTWPVDPCSPGRRGAAVAADQQLDDPGAGPGAELARRGHGQAPLVADRRAVTGGVLPGRGQCMTDMASAGRAVRIVFAASLCGRLTSAAARGRRRTFDPPPQPSGDPQPRAPRSHAGIRGGAWGQGGRSRDPEAVQGLVPEPVSYPAAPAQPDRARPPRV
jgi:hypothetical protein